MNRLPRNEHTQWSEKRGENHQPHGDTVDAHVVMDIRIGNPLTIYLVLECGLAPLKMDRQVQRKNKIEQRDDQSKQTNITITPRKQQQQERARQRNKGDQ